VDAESLEKVNNDITKLLEEKIKSGEIDTNDTEIVSK